jgi:hypothetical protein
MEPTEGFEPTTRCLQNSRSGQLSYVGTSEIAVGCRKQLKKCLLSPFAFLPLKFNKHPLIVDWFIKLG